MIFGLVHSNILSSGEATMEPLKKHHGLMQVYVRTLQTSLRSSTSIILTSQDLWPNSGSLDFLWFYPVFCFSHVLSSARLLSLFLLFQFTPFFWFHSISFSEPSFTLYALSILHFSLPYCSPLHFFHFFRPRPFLLLFLSQHHWRHNKIFKTRKSWENLESWAPFIRIFHGWKP